MKLDGLAISVRGLRKADRMEATPGLHPVRAIERQRVSASARQRVEMMYVTDEPGVLMLTV